MHIHLFELRGGGVNPSRKEPIHANRYLFVGCLVGVWSLPGQPARNTCWPRSRESRWDRLRSPGARVFESRKQCGTTERSTVAVSAHGAVFEREPAGRGCRVLLRAAEGIRTPSDGRSKGAVSEHHWFAASSARTRGFPAAPVRVR